MSQLLATKTAISVSFSISILFLFLFNNVKSDFSFNFHTFGPEAAKVIGILNQASVSNGVIQLTMKDKSGNPLKHSVGQAGIVQPIQIYDKSKGVVADFTTEFTFVVNKKGRKDHGDGFGFIIISPSFSFPDPKESSGGFLGMFNSHTAFKSLHQQVVLVEFDSFANEWDPLPISQNAHIGIDVSSIKSVATTPWASDFRPDGTVANACISYNSHAKELSVEVSYPNNGHQVVANSSLTHHIDLMTVLPEHVLIGFSASTGDLVETHDILSWSFTSTLVKK
ncbi:hypothetical protein RIF29_35531 [Crotalaria pallida]|uniref:Legume lectin domain-containing protein n=1 Tax=Crotalaria pallida TaxID=3830 RepID=A0AAN9EA20_CROPI